MHKYFFKIYKRIIKAINFVTLFSLVLSYFYSPWPAIVKSKFPESIRNIVYAPRIQEAAAGTQTIFSQELFVSSVPSATPIAFTWTAPAGATAVGVEARGGGGGGGSNGSGGAGDCHEFGASQRLPSAFVFR